MLIRVHGASLNGIDGVLICVEVDAGRGLPGFQIVGQADRVVGESRDRIRAAFRQSGLEFPKGRVTVNLAPTELPKSGSSLDLAIAVGIAATQLPGPRARLAQTLLLGELGLDGALRPVRGVLALAAVAQQAGLQEVVVPHANLEEAGVCPDIHARGAGDLAGVVDYLAGKADLCASEATAHPRPGRHSERERDLSDVRGQESAKRALEIAAAGAHNLLLVGPPGSGKTLLARRLPGLLPDLSFEQALEATRIHSVAGMLGAGRLLARPPLRAPHHTVSEAGMTGGGRPLRPGELSLAHRGVLFLDELPEFRRPILESLRQPLEEGVIRLVRAHAALALPARFQLIAAMNPCPCGYRGDASHECECAEVQLRRYRSKLSGPLLDRIDLQVSVSALSWRKITAAPPPEMSSAPARARVERARRRQEIRYAGRSYRTNAELPSRALARECALDPEAATLMERSMVRLGLSMRGYVRVLRVARSIADLAGDEALATPHLAEALSFRFGPVE